MGAHGAAASRTPTGEPRRARAWEAAGPDETDGLFRLGASPAASPPPVANHEDVTPCECISKVQS